MYVVGLSLLYLWSVMYSFVCHE